MSYRAALQGMDPEDAFRRFRRLTDAYYLLKVELASQGILDPLDALPTLKSNLALTINEELAWLKQWFPQSTPEQRVLIADLVVRALHRESNRTPEDQLFRLILLDVGTVRAEEIIGYVKQGKRPPIVKRVGMRTITKKARKLLLEVDKRPLR